MPDSTAFPNSFKLFTDNSHGIVWVCFSDLSRSGFKPGVGLNVGVCICRADTPFQTMMVIFK